MSTIETNILEFGQKTQGTKKKSKKKKKKKKKKQKTQGTYYFPEPVFLLSN